MKKTFVLPILLAVCLLLSATVTADTESANTRERIITSSCPCNGDGSAIPESELLAHEREVVCELRSLPTSFDISTNPTYSKYLPPVSNQGDLGACVAYSTVYAQFTYEVSKLLDVNARTNVGYRYSPTYIYNLLSEDPEGENGIGVIKTYDYLNKHGAIKFENFNTGLYDYAEQLPVNEDNKELLREALKIRTANRYNSISVITSPEVKITAPNSYLLNGVKTLLSQGHVLRVCSPYVWSSDINREYVFYRCSKNTEGKAHSVVVVGYDDNFTCDINGDGIIENAEKGAFKIMNSYGTNAPGTINGYSYVMYDALNYSSAVSGNWESGLSGQRSGAFISKEEQAPTGCAKNWFTWIEAEEKEVKVIGELVYHTVENYCTEVSLYNNSSNWVDTALSYAGFGERTVMAMFDYSQVYPDFEDNMYYYLGDSFNYGIKLRRSILISRYDNVSWRLTDSLGNAMTPAVTRVGVGGAFTSTDAYDLILGDVNYSQSLSTADVNYILQYCSGMRIFSELQEFLADYNQDGVVNTSDAVVLLNSLT